MISKRIFLPTLVSLVLLGGVVTGCGGDDDSTDTPTTDTGPVPTKPADSGDNGSGPASAGDESKNAPDNKISDRPGGPGSKPPANPDPVR